MPISGGDDTFLNVYDVRENASTLKLKNKSHEAGVTSLLNLEENILVTGSYDEKLRVFDTRQFKQPTHEINLGGGIWRIKPSSKNHNILLVACMYLNFSIVDIKYEVESQEKFHLKLVGDFTEHQSICYGCDWSPSHDKDYEYFSTCSFYDHKLCLCRTKT